MAAPVLQCARFRTGPCRSHARFVCNFQSVGAYLSPRPRGSHRPRDSRPSAGVWSGSRAYRSRGSRGIRPVPRRGSVPTGFSVSHVEEWKQANLMHVLYEEFSQCVPSVIWRAERGRKRCRPCPAARRPCPQPARGWSVRHLPEGNI